MSRCLASPLDAGACHTGTLLPRAQWAAMEGGSHWLGKGMGELVPSNGCRMKPCTLKFCSCQPGHASQVCQLSCRLMSRPALLWRVARMQGLCRAHEAHIYDGRNAVA